MCLSKLDFLSKDDALYASFSEQLQYVYCNEYANYIIKYSVKPIENENV